MKIYKGQYGFSTSAFGKNQTTGETIKHYVNVQFKKGTEPEDAIEGNLFFEDRNGNKRPCFLTSYFKKDGTTETKLVIMGEVKNNDYKMYGNPTPTVNNEELDLPF